MHADHKDEHDGQVKQVANHGNQPSKKKMMDADTWKKNAHQGSRTLDDQWLMVSSLTYHVLNGR